MIPFFPFILAGGAAIVAGAFLSSKSDKSHGECKAKGTQDTFSCRRISEDEVPADIRRRTSKDKRR